MEEKKSKNKGKDKERKLGRYQKETLIAFICALMIIIDQVTKSIFMNKSITIIKDFLEFNYVKNYGVAFSLANGKTIAIIACNVIIIIFLVIYIWNEKRKEKEDLDYNIIIPICFILAGGISNLIDRIFRGYVVDFIKVKLFDFPIFNIADIIITISVIFLVGHLLKEMYIAKDETGKK